MQCVVSSVLRVSFLLILSRVQWGDGANGFGGVNQRSRGTPPVKDDARHDSALLGPLMIEYVLTSSLSSQSFKR